MQKTTMINAVLLSGAMLIGGLQIQAAGQDSYDQKRMICATEQQNAAATLLQAACRGRLERQSPGRVELVRAAQLAQPAAGALVWWVENNAAATLIQAGVRGALARDTQQNDAFLSEMQSKSTGSILELSEDCESGSSDNSESSEVDEPLNQFLQQYNVGAAQETLFDAARNNRAWAIKGLLQRGANVDASNRNGSIPLIVAAGRGYVEIVRELLEARADVNIANQYGNTALTLAVCRGRVEVVQMLLEANASVNVGDRDGYIPLMLAALGGHVEIVRMLLAAGADVDIVNQAGYTPLIWAVDRGHAEIVRMLLAANADLNVADRYGYIPLIVAAGGGHVEIVRALLDAKVNVDSADQDGNTPLILGAGGGHVEIVRALLQVKADVDIADQDGNTPLILVVSGGHVEIVRALLQANADVDIADQNGNTSLMLVAGIIQVAGRGNVEIARMLIAANADVNVANNDGLSPLLVAIRESKYAIAQMLIEANADVNAGIPNGYVPIEAAIRAGQVEIAQMLINRGADIRRPVIVCSLYGTQDGYVAFAIRAGHVEIAQMLFDSGADINVPTLDLMNFCYPNFLAIFPFLVDSYRVQLAKQYSEDMMEFFSRDFDQFDRSARLQSMGNVFNQVGEVIASNMADNDLRNFVNTLCRTFAKSAVNGKNRQSNAIKKELFSQFITQILEQIILLKEEYSSEELCNRFEQVLTFLKQELEHGYYIRTSDSACAALATDVATAQDSRCDELFCVVAQELADAQQAVQTALEAERVQLQLVECATDAHVPTGQELQAMREQRARMFDGGLLIDRKGKSPA